MYNNFEGVFNLQGEMIVGELPTKQRKMVETWAIIHEEELKAKWKSIIELGQHFKIEGLR